MRSLTRPQDRRGFVAAFAALISSAFPIAQVVRGNLRRNSESTFPVFPSYIPPGYRFIGPERNSARGFRDHQSLNQTTLWFMNPRSEADYHRPLAVHFTSQPASRPFATLLDQAAEVEVTMADGARNFASYFDGRWKRDKSGVLFLNGFSGRWDRTDAHSLVLQLPGLSVAFEGYRFAGMSFTELLKVAGSIASA